MDLDIQKVTNELGGLKNASYTSLRLISAALVEFEKAWEEDKESLLVRYGTEMVEIIQHFTKETANAESRPEGSDQSSPPQARSAEEVSREAWTKALGGKAPAPGETIVLSEVAACNVETVTKALADQVEGRTPQIPEGFAIPAYRPYGKFKKPEDFDISQLPPPLEVRTDWEIPKPTGNPTVRPDTEGGEGS